MSNYTNATTVSNFLGRALTAYETTLLTTLLPAIDLWIDRYLNSTFATASATTRYYDGGTNHVDIDPCQSITTLTSVDNEQNVDYTYTILTDFTVEPANETVKTEIIKRGRGCFTEGSQRLALTAKFTEYDFTNAKVPDGIVIAATRIAGGVLGAGKAAGQGGNIQSESLEGHSVTYDASQDAINTVATSDPIIQGILSSRKTLLL